MTQKNKQGGAGGILAILVGIVILAAIAGVLYMLLKPSAEKKPVQQEQEEIIPAATGGQPSLADIPPADPICDYINRAIADNVILPNGVDFRKLRGTTWEAPVKYPALTKKEVRVAAEAAVQAEIDAKYSEEYKQKFRADAKREAEELYKLLQEGEEVSFATRQGVGPNAMVKGKFYGVSGERVRIDRRWLLRLDVPEEIQARIWQDAHVQAVNDFCRKKELALQGDLKFARIDAEKKLYPDIFRQNGYVPDIFNAASNRDKVVDEYWISARELYEKIKRIGI